MSEPNGETRIVELRLRNYRGFRDAKVTFEPDLTILVGHNGSGKSTILDAFEFIHELHDHGLRVALDRRGGFRRVLNSLAGDDQDFGIAVVLSVMGVRVVYGFEVGARRGAPVVKTEAVVAPAANPRWAFQRQEGSVSMPWGETAPFPSDDAAVLPGMAGYSVFYGTVRHTLRLARTYHLTMPGLRQEPQVASADGLLVDGGNLGDVVSALPAADNEYVTDRLGNITPGLTAVRTDVLAGRRVLKVRQRLHGRAAHILGAGQLSDGTLRALAILVALRQTPQPSMVLIDEFEDSIHPAEVEGLLDAAWTTARQRSAVVITTHSPELLDHDEIEGRNVRLIRWEDGESHVHRLAENTARLIDGRKESAGSLLRANVLNGLGTPERAPANLYELP